MKNLVESVMNLLKSQLGPFAFDRQGRKASFHRLTNYGYQSYHFGVADYRPEYRLFPRISVRFDAVEEFFHRTSGVEKKYQQSWTTVAIDLWNQFGSDYRLPLSSEDDVEPVTARLMAIFHEKAEPFYAQFNNLDAVDAALNSQPQGKKPIYASDGWDHWCATGLIVAKMVGRENYDELVAAYREKIKKMDSGTNGAYLPKFEALLKDLERSNFWPSSSICGRRSTSDASGTP